MNAPIVNRPTPQPEPVGAAEIDALVDGGLSDPERRSLLLRLEADPEGWRRCALAFLEDQEFRRALVGLGRLRSALPAGSMGGVGATGSPANPRDGAVGGAHRFADEPVAPIGQDQHPSPLGIGPPSNPAGPRSTRVGARKLAVAASLLALTFGLGYATGGGGHRPDLVEASPPITSKPRPAEPEVPGPAVDPTRMVEEDAGGARKPALVAATAPAPDEWSSIRPRQAVSGYDRARLARQGIQVEERRRMVPAVREDGRTVEIPVDEIAVEFVGQRPL